MSRQKTNDNKGRLLSDIILVLLAFTASFCIDLQNIYIVKAAIVCMSVAVISVIGAMIYELYSGARASMHEQNKGGQIATYIIFGITAFTMVIPVIWVAQLFKTSIITETSIDNISFAWKVAIGFMCCIILFQWVKTIFTRCFLGITKPQKFSKSKAYGASLLCNILTGIVILSMIGYTCYVKYPYVIIYTGIPLAILKYLASLMPIDDGVAKDAMYNRKTSYIWLVLFVIAYVWLEIDHWQLFKISFDSPHYDAAIEAGIGINVIMYFVWLWQNTLFDTTFGGKVLYDLKKRFGIGTAETKNIIPGYGSLCDAFFWVFVHALPLLVGTVVYFFCRIML